MRTKKDWLSFNSTSPLSFSADSRIIIIASTDWSTIGDYDEPSIIRVVGSATVWSEDDDVTDAATLYRIAWQFSKAARSANPRAFSEGFDSDFKWLAGGMIINSGATADQIHAWGRVGKHFYDFRPAFRVVDLHAEIAFCAQMDAQTGALTPLLVSFEGRMLISAGY